MQELSDKEIAANALVGGLPTNIERLDGFIVRLPITDAFIDQVRSCVTAGTGLAGVPSGLGKSWFGRYVRVDSSVKEVGVSHRPVAADTAKNMVHHRESVGVEYLARHVDAETDFEAWLETLREAHWSRKSAFAEQFRLRQGEHLGMDVARDPSANRKPGGTADGTGKSALALCRLWADLDRYSALQAHFDACDAQLS
jgi:hypothetical protein